MDFSSFDSIKASGFIGFIPIKQLIHDRSIIPIQKGVYMILYPLIGTPEFAEVGSGPQLYKKKTDPNVPLYELENNLIEGAKVLYIGKAGGKNQEGNEGMHTLRKRLTTYFSFGMGKDVRHYGGRFIWQLEASSDLLVCWMPTPNDEPREIEQYLIKAFLSCNGRRPFANRKD